MKKKTVLLSVLSVAAIVTCVATALAIKAPKALYNAKAEPLTITFDKNSEFDYDEDDGYILFTMKTYTKIDNLPFTNNGLEEIYATDGDPLVSEFNVGKDNYDNDCIFSVANTSYSAVYLSFLFDETYATLTRVIFSVLIDGVADYNFNKDNVMISDYGGMGKTVSIYYSGSNDFYYVPYGHEITFVSITFEYTC